MPTIYGTMSVKNGQKQAIMNLSNARQKTYAQVSSMTAEQKKGVIICPDYPDSAFLVQADQVGFDKTGTSLSSNDVEGAIKEVAIKKTSIAGTTNANGLLATGDTSKIIIKAIEVSSRLTHWTVLIGTYNYDATSRETIFKVVNTSTMSPVANESVNIEYYYI